MANARSFQKRRCFRERGRGHQKRACPFFSRAAGSSASVRVRIGIGGGLGVNHAPDVLHVDAASGDVGCDKRVEPSAFEFGKSSIALSLFHFAGERVNVKAGLRQITREMRHVGSRAGEDERLFAGAGEEKIDDRGDAIL